MNICKVSYDDLDNIFELYKKVSYVNTGNLTQFPNEIYKNYIKNEIFENALNLGLCVVVKDNNKVVGLMKSYTSEYKALAHIMTNTTIMIHPDYQNHGYGKKMVETFLKIIMDEMQHIYMLEIVPHANNIRALDFYLKNNFKIESKTTNRILTQNNTMVDEVKMIWENPNFDYNKLLEYHKYCSEYLKRKYNE